MPSGDQDFVDLVAQDVRGNLSDEQRTYLYQDENVDRRYNALVKLKKNVEVQLVNAKSRSVKKRDELNKAGDDGTRWVEYRAEEADWRARAIKFLSAIEEHIIDVKKQRHDFHTLSETDEDETVLWEDEDEDNGNDKVMTAGA